MRNRIGVKIAALAALIVATMNVAPAMACYGGCWQGFNFGIGTGYGYGCGAGYGCGGGYSVAYGRGFREQLTDPTGPRSDIGPQYYYVNQGPYYTGPGTVAPAPTYQERAVGGWYSTSDPYYYGYYGGPYANATNHLYDGAHLGGPAIYTYRGYRRHGTSRTYYRSPSRAPRYYNTSRSGVHYGYAGPRTQGERMRIY